MSHFTVVVICHPDNLENMMAPYDESIEVDPYLEPISDTEWAAAVKYFESIGDEVDWFEWSGSDLHIDEDGNKFEYKTYNPESKWDWYTIGGRWRGFFPLKSSITIPADDSLTGDLTHATTDSQGYLGEYGGVFDADASPGTVDAGPKGALEMVIPYACVDDEGWHELGTMGWFGLSHETEEGKDEFEQWFKAMWDALPDEQWVTMVDCHI